MEGAEGEVGLGGRIRRLRVGGREEMEDVGQGG